MLLFGAIALTAMTATAKPGAESIAAVFPLWWSERESILAAASADASIVRFGALPSIVVVRPSPNDGAKRLADAGAWLALDPLALDACFTKSETTN